MKRKPVILSCDTCHQKGFKSLAGLAGHMYKVHGVVPGKHLAGVKAEAIDERLQRLESRQSRMISLLAAVAQSVGMPCDLSAYQLQESGHKHPVLKKLHSVAKKLRGFGGSETL